MHASSDRRAGRSTRSTVQRALLSGKSPVDRPVDRTKSCALCILASVDRSVDRSPNGWISDRCRSTGRSTDSSVRPPTASFWSPINWAIWGLFSLRFSSEFFTSFPNSFKRFSPLVLEQIFPIKRRVYQECLKEIFLEFFLHHLFPCFLTQTLELSIVISTSRVLL